MDPYLGLLKIPKIGDGFLMTRAVDEMWPNLEVFPTWEGFGLAREG